MRILVCGGGNGALATAVYLAKQGHEIGIAEHPSWEKALREFLSGGGIQMRDPAGETFVRVELADISNAGAYDGVVICVPAPAVEEFAKLLAQHLRNGQRIMFHSAGGLNALRFVRWIEDAGHTPDLRLSETATLAFGCRKDAPGHLTIHLYVKEVYFSALPGNRTPEEIGFWRALFPCLVPSRNVLENALQNTNPVAHPAPTVLNAGWIETAKGEFYLYRMGVTPSVAKVMNAVDEERLALCRVLGFAAVPVKEGMVRRGYARPAASVGEQYRQSVVFRDMRGPDSLDVRYLLEDIPYGLTLWSSLGRKLGIPTPTIDAIVTLGGELCGRDFWKDGLTMESVGLDPLSPEL